jgi:uncharacterized membrane protein SirB2
LLEVDQVSYLLLKHLHVTCVVLTLSGFCLRGLLLLRKSALTGRQVVSGGRWLRWLRVLPHLNDSVLLAAGIALTLQINQYPFIDAWLTAKFFGLVAYIMLGSLALKPGRPPTVRLGAGLLAIVVFAWLVLVALSKQPYGGLL